MTAPECPVCATPYEPGAATCAFCGVSLREPPANPDPELRTDAAAEPATESEPRAQDPPPSAEAVEPATVEVATDASATQAAATDEPATETGTDEATADDAPSDAAATNEPATESRTDEATADEATADDAPSHAPATAEPATDGVAMDDPAVEEARSSPTPAEADAATAPPADEPLPDAVEEAGTADIPAIAAPGPVRTRTPSFARKPTDAGSARRRARRIEWSVVAGLAALLLVQVVASDFDQLAGDAATRPWLQRACTVLRCTLPAWREPQALRLLQRDVRANPARPGLLRISASFRNEARWAQPWPRLRVTLSDADGRTIAARDFAANEYLGTTPTANGIASGQVAGVAVDVVDPSPRVTAFTFEFR